MLYYIIEWLGKEIPLNSSAIVNQSFNLFILLLVLLLSIINILGYFFIYYIYTEVWRQNN